MAQEGRGTIVITGGMPETVPEYASLSLGKAAVRALVELLDQTYGPAGVHAATVTVYGAVAAGDALRSGRHRRGVLAAAHPAGGRLGTRGRVHRRLARRAQLGGPLAEGEHTPAGAASAAWRNIWPASPSCSETSRCPFLRS